MNTIFNIFPFLFLFSSITVRNVAAELKPFEIALSGLDILTSLNDPTELFQSLSSFVSLIVSDEDTSKDDLSVIQSTLTDINDKLDEISEEIQGFREEVMNKLKELNTNILLISRLDDFFKLGETIDFYYHRFKEVSKVKYARAAYLDDFIKTTRSLKGGVEATLNQMHNALSIDRWTPSAFNELSDNTIVSLLVCSRGRSQQIIILNLFKALCAAEIKGLTMDLFAIEVQMKNKHETTWESQNAQNEFVERSNRAVLAAKKAMSKASREFWNCNSNPQEGVTFEKFGPFIYKSFEPEAGLSTIVDGYYTWTRCVGDCARYTEAENMCEADIINSYCDGFLHICPGTVRNCESFDSHVTMCNTQYDTSKRRYQYVEGNNGKLFGENTGSCNAGISSFSEYLDEFYYCQVCLCTCENIDPNLDIYINLKEVVSDVYRNNVIVGVRLKKIDNIFHLQIQQAVLLPSGLVDLKTKLWVKVNRYNITDRNVKDGVDYLRLSWNVRSVELNDIYFDDGIVVTGVKFTYARGLIKLEARGHKFSYKQGKLKTNYYSWYRNKERPRDLSELELYYVDLPSDYANNPILSYPGQYMTLTTSSLKHDVGQTIVPFVDVQPVESKQPTPLAGVGLFHKSHRNGAAGYLALKILNYDYAGILRGLRENE